MKRKLLSGLMITGLMLAGCGNNESAEGSNEGVTNLEWFMWAGNDAEVESWKKMTEKVNEENPDIHVELKTAPWPEYWSKLQTQVAGGTAPDIISMQSMRLPGFKSALKPLNEYIEGDDSVNTDDFNETILENMKDGEEQMVIPYDFGPMIMFYNKDLFEKYNVPTPEPGWTWADFENAAKALSKEGNYGFVSSGYPDYWLPLALSNGGIYLDGDKYKINDSKNIGTVQKLADMIDQGISPKMIATNNGSWSQEQWLKGNIGMVADGPWSTLWYKDSATFEFGVATLPVGEKDSVSLSAGSGFAVSESTEHPEEAFEAIKSLTDAAAQQELASTGRAYPAHESAREEYYSQVPEEFKAVLEYANEHTVPYEITEKWNQVSDMIAKAMIPILNGEVSPKEGLNQLQKQIEGIQ